MPSYRIDFPFVDFEADSDETAAEALATMLRMRKHVNKLFRVREVANYEQFEVEPRK